MTKIILYALAGLLGFSGVVSAQTALTQDELRALLSDTQSVDEWPNGDRGEASTTADGKVTYKWIPKTGKAATDTGTWKLKKDNVACFIWRTFNNGCYAYYKEADGYLVHNARNQNDKFKKTLLP